MSPKSPVSLPSQQFQSLNPVSFWQPPANKEQTPEQLYIPLSTMINELRRLPESDPRLAGQITDFDAGCQRILAKFATIKPEKIEPMLSYVRFPFPREGSSDFRFGVLPESMSSSEFSEFPVRTPSFVAHPLLDSADFPRDISLEQLSTHSIWQTRPFDDTKIMYFECAHLTRDIAGIATTSFGSTHKVLSVLHYREPDAQWQSFGLGTDAGVDGVAIGSESAWALFDSTVGRVSLWQKMPVQSVRIPAVGSGSIAVFGAGAVVAFPTSSQLSFLTPLLGVMPVAVPYRGITCLGAIEDNLVCGICGSGTMRLIRPDGREVRAFVGHCGQVMGIEWMSDAIFASRGEDDTVRIWDIRERSPISSVLLPRVSVVSLTGSSGYVVFGLHTKRIGVIELRKDRGKAVLGVPTQDYVAVAMKFDQPSDSLAMFGVVDKELVPNSMVFVDNDGQSRQRIFRKYTNFIGRIPEAK
jgi:hypothetical protein